jgi:hypothetical protein
MMEVECTVKPDGDTRSYKVGVKTRGDKDWACNALRFETVEEARLYGSDLAGRWTAVESWTVLPCEEEPNRKVQRAEQAV